MIFFEAIAGLCNRMRALVSACGFAQAAGQPLTIIWCCNRDCNCRFDMLFDLKENSSVSFIYTLGGRLGNHTRIVKRIKSRCDHVYEDNPFYLNKDDMLIEVQDKDVYLSSYSYWYKIDNPFGMLEVKARIQEKINEFKVLCEPYGIGVHIRRTDHNICIQKSPIEAFIKHMSEEVAKNPSVKFFVASDDGFEKERLKEVFGEERIITNNQAVLKRNRKLGIEDAVIDLYVLSEMQFILGSNGSSFSEVAAQIKGIPLIRCEIN